jgi:hypothetical protein
MTTNINILSAVEIETLTLLSDLIIPRHGKLPSASDLGLCELINAETFRIRPDLLDPVRALLSTCTPNPTDLDLQALSTAMPKEFFGLMQVVAGTYYMQPQVKALLGYSGQRRIHP